MRLNNYNIIMQQSPSKTISCNIDILIQVLPVIQVLEVYNIKYKYNNILESFIEKIQKEESHMQVKLKQINMDSYRPRGRCKKDITKDLHI